MKFTFGLVLTVALAALVGFGVQAEDKKGDAKPVTLKGTITCSKCDLGETKVCGNVIQVKEGGKTTTYYFVDKGAKEKYHGKVCRSPAEGSVTGVVSTKDKKHYITPGKDGVKFN